MMVINSQDMTRCLNHNFKQNLTVEREGKARPPEA